MAREPMPDVIVLLPGILGSVLQRNGKDVWAPSGSAFFRALISLGDSLQDLALRTDGDPQDGVTATRLMPDVHLIPGFWKIDGYSKIRDTIRQTFDVTEGKNYVEFAYDWRLDNAISAQRLKEAADGWLHRRRQDGHPNAKLILVGHSMGGIVARYFLEVLGGWQDTRLLVTFGTPYRGSLNALDVLANGTQKLHGLLDFTALARSLPSVYQLLPVYECYDHGDGQLVRIGETSGIPNVDAARAKKALNFHNTIREHVDRRLRDHGPRSGYGIVPVVGIEQPTRQAAVRSGGGVDLLNTHRGVDRRGDGTVPRVSATPHELSDDPREMYAATKHASLQNADPVLTQLAGSIMRLGFDLGDFLAPEDPRVKLSLAIEDAFDPGEPVVVRVRPNNPAGVLTARIIRADRSRATAKATLTPAGDGWLQAEFAPLPDGVYRVVVSGGARVEPASDIFAVLPAA
jgi:hypothetical protein